MKTWSINIIGFSDDEERTEHLAGRRSGYASRDEALAEKRKLFAPDGAYHAFDGYAKIVEEEIPDEPMKMTKEQIRSIITTANEDEFYKICENLPEDIERVFVEMRFYHRMFNDPSFYKDVEQAVCKAFCESLHTVD